MFSAKNTVRGGMSNPVDEDENDYVKLEGHQNHSCDLLKLQWSAGSSEMEPFQK